eukprot:Blabericola_migrator_1__1508@NODE_139_length_13119_cov_94_960389_g121_i0_p7_GENE_NODE_139_length_13119_cov_94_960389_g121_i0NODE_139_length_13119_cov_94_960389_g121_i0_p7_ORF_typecomplete_len271_score31_35_NODE_139_length_13119_cov_94_960389_g121_i01124812060
MTFLECLRKCYVIELLTLEWIESFWQHITLSLSPTQYLQWTRKIKLLVDVWAGGLESLFTKSKGLEVNAANDVSMRLPYGRYQAPTGVSALSLVPLWMVNALSYSSVAQHNGLQLASLRVKAQLRIVSDEHTGRHGGVLKQSLEADECRAIEGDVVDELMTAKSATESRTSCLQMPLPTMLVGVACKDDFLQKPRKHEALVCDNGLSNGPVSLTERRLLDDLWRVLSSNNFELALCLLEVREMIIPVCCCGHLRHTPHYLTHPSSVPFSF